MSEHLESWLEWRDQAERPVPGYVEDELRGYLECGILCFGFARAVCMTCRTGVVVAFSCKRRGVCPSCNGRHMAQTAAQIFLDEIERLLCVAAGVTEAANIPTAACPRLGAGRHGAGEKATSASNGRP